MTMSVNLIEGNILTPPTRNENTIICHQVNCRAAMGAGLARQIRDKWPVVFDEYVKVCSPEKLGDFQMVQVAPQLYVANLFGQSSFGRDKRQTNYAALGTALFRAMKEHPDATFRVPYGLGCGLAGGNWATVLNLIEEAANAWNVNVEIWALPKKVKDYHVQYQLQMRQAVRCMARCHWSRWQENSISGKARDHLALRMVRRRAEFQGTFRSG